LLLQSLSLSQTRSSTVALTAVATAAAAATTTMQTLLIPCRNHAEGDRRISLVTSAYFIDVPCVRIIFERLLLHPAGVPSIVGVLYHGPGCPPR